MLALVSVSQLSLYIKFKSNQIFLSWISRSTECRISLHWLNEVLWYISRVEEIIIHVHMYIKKQNKQCEGHIWPKQ